MIALDINYNNSVVGFLTKGLSMPPVGQLATGFFYNTITRAYTGIFLEISGFQLYIKDLSVQDATVHLKHQNSFLRLLMVLVSNKSPFANNTKGQELFELITKITDKLKENITMLEDITSNDWAYAASSNHFFEDWNSPENDHWDKY